MTKHLVLVWKLQKTKKILTNLSKRKVPVNKNGFLQALWRYQNNETRTNQDPASITINSPTFSSVLLPPVKNACVTHTKTLDSQSGWKFNLFFLLSRSLALNCDRERKKKKRGWRSQVDNEPRSPRVIMTQGSLFSLLSLRENFWFL